MGILDKEKFGKYKGILCLINDEAVSGVSYTDVEVEIDVFCKVHSVTTDDLYKSAGLRRMLRKFLRAD